MRNVRLLLLAAVAAVSTVGCQSDATGTGDVTPPPPSPLTVAPSLARLNNGQAIRLVARLRLANGSTATPEDVTWSSADVRIASVDRSGTVQALRAGRVQIVASWHESRGSSVILVADPVAKKPKQCFALKATGSDIPTEGPCA